MLKVGITGNIGSGKSLVCRLFSVLGIPIYDADSRAKELMNTDPKLISEIKHHFGVQSYFEGKLDRAYLAKLVFGAPRLLEILNQIVHPAVKQDSDRWFYQQNSIYAIKEAALIIETQGYKDLDVLILVTAPKTLRIKRVQKRDGLSASAIRARMDSQISEKEKIPYADFVIINDGHHLLSPQIWKIHQKLIHRSKS